MLGTLRHRLTYANIVSSLALFLVLSGGTAVALTGSNTVFSDDIKNGEVKAADVAPNAVSGGKVVDNSLGPREIVPNSLNAGRLAPNAVTGSELAGDAVTGPKVANDSLKAEDIDESTFATNPSGAAGGDLTGSYPNPTIRAPKTMHYVGASGEPGFNSGWDNLGAGWAPASFYKDRDGVVHLRGLLRTPSTGSSGDVLYLPEGYRPCDTPGAHGGELLFPSHSGDPGQAARVDISYYGTVSVHNYAANSHLTLNGITFPSENC